MKKILSVIIICCTILSCANDKKETPAIGKNEVKIDSTLITDSSWGPIQRNTNFEELKKMYGEANVKDQRICGPECIDSIDVTILHQGTNNEFTIYWQDTAYHKTIWMIETYLPEAPYHTSTGLKMGSTLSDLFKLNGKKITFSGFGWDYGGYIQSYAGGALENSSIHFRLERSEGGDDTGLVGDIELNTDMQVVKASMDKIRVWQLSLTPNQAKSDVQ